MMISLDEFFRDHDDSRAIFEGLLILVEKLDPVEFRVSKSQIALCRDKPFAWIWIPARYLRGKVAPLVLTISFQYPDPSPRWKQIVEPAPGRFMHHLELHSSRDIDDEVRAWLQSSWELAG